MNQPVVPVQVSYADPQLADLLDAHAKAIMLGFNCHAIAIVDSFTAQDSVTGRPKLTATMAYSRTFTVQTETGEYVNQLRNYPALVDCPVVMLGGGTVSLQMPIAKGDTCLILFNDRDINNWWAGANAGPVASSRLHSFSDGIALVGLGKWLVNDATHALLTNGDARVGIPISGAKVLIGNTSTTLYTLLSQLITAINGIQIAGVSAGGATLGISPASTTALNSANTALQALLE